MAVADDLTLDLCDRLRASVSSGRMGVARPLLNAVKRLSGVPDDLGELEARLLLQEGRDYDALSVLDSALQRTPHSAKLRLCRAETRRRLGDPVAAAQDAAEALVLQPELSAAKAILGHLLMELSQHADAVVCLQEAVASDPGNPAWRQALAQALDFSGHDEAACATLEGGIAFAPGHVGLRTAAILQRLHHRHYVEAEALADAARREGVADACVFGLLGHARSSLGRHDAAAEAYAEARKLAPEDPYVRHLAAAAGLSADAGRASPDYIRVVFDGYADRFDAHLISLGYRVPGLMRVELEHFNRDEGIELPALDLGCGTGLVAVALSDLPIRPLIGVDLSPAMLARAAERNLYIELHESDLETYLAADTRQYPLILAADVLPYFGDLLPICKLIHDRLCVGGQLLFSVELAEAAAADAAWSLGRLGRYTHSRNYIAHVANTAGLAVRFMRPETLRLEGRAPVSGLFVALTRPAA